MGPTSKGREGKVGEEGKGRVGIEGKGRVGGERTSKEDDEGRNGGGAGLKVCRYAPVLRTGTSEKSLRQYRHFCQKNSLGNVEFHDTA